MFAYYDIVLLLIPLTLLGVGGSLSIVGLPLVISIPIGAALSALLVGHALFVRSPTSATPDAPPELNRPSHP